MRVVVLANAANGIIHVIEQVGAFGILGEQEIMGQAAPSISLMTEAVATLLRDLSAVARPAGHCAV